MLRIENLADLLIVSVSPAQVPTGLHADGQLLTEYYPKNDTISGSSGRLGVIFVTRCFGPWLG
jgi:hypothetical protein